MLRSAAQLPPAKTSCPQFWTIGKVVGHDRRGGGRWVNKILGGGKLLLCCRRSRSLRKSASCVQSQWNASASQIKMPKKLLVRVAEARFEWKCSPDCCALPPSVPG